MKLIISFLWLLSTSSEAMIVIQSQSKNKASIVKDIFEQKYQIPSDLIEVKKISKCRMCHEKIAACLCINKKGELKTLSFDMITLKKSFSVFRLPVGGNQ